MCNMMNNESGVAAIFGPESSTSTTILESISTKFQVPYIVTSWRSPNLKPSRSFLNFFPEANRFGHGLAEIVKSFGWKSFVIIYEHDDALLKLQEIFNMQKFKENDKTNRIVLEKLGHGLDFRSTLAKIERSTLTNVILDCGTQHIMSILYQAKTMNMLNVYNNYFLTNLDAHTLDYSNLDTTANITTIKIFDENNEFLKNYVRTMGIGELVHHKKLTTELALFYDAFWFMNDTLSELGPSMMTNRIDCSGEEKSVEGRNLINFMKTRPPTTPTLTGPLTFDVFGNRNLFNIHVVDILHDKKIATWYAFNQSLNVNRDFDETLTAVSNLQGTKVIVVSKLGNPYLILKANADENELEGNARYEGYSLDLIANIAKIIGFEFEIQLTESNQYGHWDEVNERWTGLIGDILEKRAHLGVGDLTITPERQEVVDFSLPFMNLGISILHKKQNIADPNRFAFLKPFSEEVWYYLGYMFLLVSVIHYVILRISAEDWDDAYLDEECNDVQESIWSFKNTVWNVFRSMATQSCDKAPKGFSARIATVTWWFFCLTVSSIYISNLSVFISQANSDFSSINNVEDLAKQNKVKYGLVKGGSTEYFFRNSNFTTYQRMWSVMEQDPLVFGLTNSEGVSRVASSKNAKYAFLMESTQIEYELERNCDLKQVGDLLDSKSYGIAMPMNSPYKSAINKAILKMQESGQLTELKKKWWKVDSDEPLCEFENGDSSTVNKLTFEDTKGLFMLLGIGVIVSLLLALTEFLWNVRKIANNKDMYFSDVLKEELQFTCQICTIRRKARSSQEE
nr:glutamate receptor ionotropic, kainate 2-like [Leptinotarsa decemlineata]